jgi:hypothetical protein
MIQRRKTQSGLSAECSSCYTALLSCILDSCFDECTSDPQGCDCSNCQVDNGCTTAFLGCTGLTPEQ